VLVAGDPEQAAYRDRSANGIPLPAGLVKVLRVLADGCGAKYLLEESP
jgi:LDH2 family malate/lactate/ureidoglycolate dehydrogenase